jgi:hypothetical protein
VDSSKKGDGAGLYDDKEQQKLIAKYWWKDEWKRLGRPKPGRREINKTNLIKQAVKREQDWTGLERGLGNCLPEDGDEKWVPVS